MHNFKLIFILSILNFCCNGIEGVKILGMFPCPSKSHYILGQALFEELAAKGHEITFVSSFEVKLANENITQIKLDGMLRYLEDNGMNPDFLTKREKSILEGITNLVYGTATMSDYTLGHPKIQQLLKSDKQFDLLIMDSFLSDSLLGFAYHYGIPSIVLSSTATNKFSNEMVANPNNPAYNPSIYLGFSDNMSLVERFINTLISVFDEFNYKFLYLPSQEAIYKRYFSPKNNDMELPSLLTLIHNVSIVFVNSNPVLHYPRPYVPSMIEIGGMHIKKIKKNDLSKDILTFIENAEDGVIYFSMGGNLRSSELPSEILEAFTKTFTNLKKIRVIWKWENATMANQPNNVVIGPWMPQQEILAHPNVRLFITHGGLLGCMEAIYYGKPMIGIPIFGDQNLNMMRAQINGYALKLNYDNITEEIVTKAIETVLYDKSYRENALKASSLFRETHIHPLEKATYYIDYVLKTGGATHLRTGALHLSFWERHLIDVSLLIVLVILTVLLILSAIIQILLRKSNQASIHNPNVTNGTVLVHRRPSKNKLFQKTVSNIKTNVNHLTNQSHHSHHPKTKKKQP